jgi:hypothetical protein
MGNWKFFLANSSNLEIQKDITPEARSKQLSLSHNRPGSFSCSLPLNSENYNNTFSNQKCIMVMKNNNFVWSGPIWSRSIDLSTEKIDLSAVGWFEILMHRYLYTTKNYTAKDGTIAFNLLDTANEDIPTWITKGSSASNTDRVVSYEVFQSIGENILELSNMQAGFDMKVDPVTRQLNIKAYDDVADRTAIPFGFNWGVNNVANVVIEENGGEMRNRVTVVGANSSAVSYPSSPGSSASLSQSQNNLLAEVIQMTETDKLQLIEARANSEGALKEYPQVDYQISLKPQGVGNPYEFFIDYDIGDKIYITIQKQISGQNLLIEYSGRVFGAAINIDENGRETVSSLQMRFSG